MFFYGVWASFNFFGLIICKGSPASMDAFAHDVSHLTFFFFFFLGAKSKSCNFSNIICTIVLFSLYPLFCNFFCLLY